MKNKRILKKLIRLHACDDGIYKFIKSGFINEDIGKIRKIKLHPEDVDDFEFLIEILHLTVKIEIMHPDSTWLLGKATHIKEFKDGLLIREETIDGDWETWEYDEKGLLHKIESSDKDTIIINRIYDDKGKLVKLIHSDGYGESYEYDENGNCIREDVSNGYWIILKYDNDNREIYFQDDTGDIIRKEYDSKGRLIKDIISNINLGEDDALTYQSWKYDDNGNIVEKSDWGSGKAKYYYDSHNRLIESKYPNGKWEKIKYDTRGNKIEHIYPDGEVSTYTYDENNNIINMKMSNPPEIHGYEILEWV